jgi:hypothetical protein
MCLPAGNAQAERPAAMGHEEAHCVTLCRPEPGAA